MKSSKLAIILSAIMLSAASLAQAGDTDRLNHQFMSKRAFHAPVENSKTYAADAPWEGATYRPAVLGNEDAFADKNTRNLNQLKINSLSKRPFM